MPRTRAREKDDTFFVDLNEILQSVLYNNVNRVKRKCMLCPTLLLDSFSYEFESTCQFVFFNFRVVQFYFLLGVFVCQLLRLIQFPNSGYL